MVHTYCLSSWFHATPILAHPRRISGDSSPSQPSYKTAAMSAQRDLIPSDRSFHWWIPLGAGAISWNLELGLRISVWLLFWIKGKLRKLQEIAIFHHVNWVIEKAHLHCTEKQGWGREWELSGFHMVLQTLASVRDTPFCIPPLGFHKFTPNLHLLLNSPGLPKPAEEYYVQPKRP